MVENTFGQGTPINTAPFGGAPTPPPITPKQQCKIDGGFWDEATQTCIFAPKKEEEPPKVFTNVPEVGEVVNDPTQTVTLPDGREFTGLNKADVALLAQQQSGQGLPPGTAPAGTTQAQADAQFRGQQLSGGVGQFGQLPISPTGLDTGEALTTGVVGSIPSALRLAGQFGVGAAVLGAAATAPIGGIGAAPAAAIGAAVGFVAGIAGGMLSNFKSQRSDSTTAQQRILDEGKQTMKDWATLAKNDPANKAYYLAEYNKQSAQINQAYRQMKLDTSKDVAKFETALPNLAEFESFYSFGGERDTLDIEMRNALLAQAPPNYDMLELSFRRIDE